MEIRNVTQNKGRENLHDKTSMPRQHSDPDFDPISPVNLFSIILFQSHRLIKSLCIIVGQKPILVNKWLFLG